METTFSVPGVTCQGCDRAIRRALGAVPGVSGVSVDVAARTVKVTHGGSAGRDVLAETLERAGYPSFGPNTGMVRTAAHPGTGVPR